MRGREKRKKRRRERRRAEDEEKISDDKIETMHLEDDGIEKRLRCKRRRQISRVYAAHNTATQTLELVNIVGSVLSVLCKQNLHISQFLRDMDRILVLCMFWMQGGAAESQFLPSHTYLFGIVRRGRQAARCMR